MRGARLRAILDRSPGYRPKPTRRAAGLCSTLASLSARETAYLNTKLDALNPASDATAKEAGVEFIDVTDAFDVASCVARARAMSPQGQRLGARPFGRRFANATAERITEFPTVQLGPSGGSVFASANRNSPTNPGSANQTMGTLSPTGMDIIETASTIKDVVTRNGLPVSANDFRPHDAAYKGP